MKYLFILHFALLTFLQPSLSKICSCSDMYTFSDSSYAGVSVSYSVPAGQGCCSGTATGTGYIGEVHYNSSGGLDSVDYCETTASFAQSYCC